MRAFSRLVPELACADLDRSLRFYCDILGATVLYDRPEEGFAFMELQGAQFMLDRLENAWLTGSMEPPLGRGVNFQIEVVSVSDLSLRLADAGVATFLGPQTRWYRDGGVEHGQVQLLVQDPDGYLLRFAQSLGARAVCSDPAD
ncbi:MAG: glyoxalase/bleomycin resistance protein/dioxygenase [Rhodobacteraceae bacterium]|uniref:bleomycin resistance protein n=1 Tax=Cypionkella sp. TaxID=2811411 RepID=UPI00132A6891|nr:VOC family protein [Cypionkella sp.]KAF0172664.1 MAG: glyoxalase/bleomycin resistance protein/dioxygenase [Paracoccaceae bacterium]MDO8325995.1 VOC family protein [Cypionkella sp.]